MYRAQANDFEIALSGGHPNSLGNTEAVVEKIIGDETLLRELMECYRSLDPVVRLRVSSVLKRISQRRPEWLVPYIDELLGPVAAIDQASTQWTLAILFKRLMHRMTLAQSAAAIAIVQRNLDESNDWIVQNTTMQVMAGWAGGDPSLAAWLHPRLDRLSSSPRKSVSNRARKLMQELSTTPEGSRQPPRG